MINKKGIILISVVVALFLGVTGCSNTKDVEVVDNTGKDKSISNTEGLTNAGGGISVSKTEGFNNVTELKKVQRKLCI